MLSEEKKALKKKLQIRLKELEKERKEDIKNINRRINNVGE